VNPLNINQIEFTIFDTETTGLSPQAGDRVVEIAAVRIKGKERLGFFQSLVNPDREICEAAFQVNHIGPEMLVGAPRMKEVVPGFLEFIKGSCLCSYNAAFDMDFLNQELALCGCGSLALFTVIDILKMARRLLPGMERYALWFVADKLGIKTQQQHRALSDVELTLAVFDSLRQALRMKEIVDFDNFSHLFSISQVTLDDLNNRKIAQIQEAMDLGMKIEIKYLSASSAVVSERQVVPKQLRQDKGRAYLVGHCCLRKDERTFRIDSILNIELVKDRPCV